MHPLAKGASITPVAQVRNILHHIECLALKFLRQDEVELRRNLLLFLGTAADLLFGCFRSLKLIKSSCLDGLDRFLKFELPILEPSTVERLDAFDEGFHHVFLPCSVLNPTPDCPKFPCRALPTASPTPTASAFCKSTSSAEVVRV